VISSLSNSQINRRGTVAADELETQVANEVEKTYPGHVEAVNRSLGKDAAGKTVGEVDVELKNAAIEVTSGTKGKIAQAQKIAAATGKPTIVYGPNLGIHAIRGMQRAGVLVTTSLAELISVVAPDP